MLPVREDRCLLVTSSPRDGAERPFVGEKHPSPLHVPVCLSRSLSPVVLCLVMTAFTSEKVPISHFSQRNEQPGYLRELHGAFLMNLSRRC